LLKISHEAAGKPRCRVSCHVDEEVYIALRRVFATRYRAKEE
jgi:hypothetical protein